MLLSRRYWWHACQPPPPSRPPVPRGTHCFRRCRVRARPAIGCHRQRVLASDGGCHSNRDEFGAQHLSSLGLVSPAASPQTAVRGNRLYGAQAIDTSSAGQERKSAFPTPGEGRPHRPSRGVDQGAGTVGFDCSGLTRFAFAGVGAVTAMVRRPVQRWRKFLRPRRNAATCCSGDPAEANTKRSGRRKND